MGTSQPPNAALRQNIVVVYLQDSAKNVFIFDGAEIYMYDYYPVVFREESVLIETEIVKGFE